MFETKYIELIGELIQETDKAIQFDCFDSIGGHPQWIPRSLIQNLTKFGDNIHIIIPEWLAYEKEFM